MEKYNKTFEVIWADIDPNRHLRHSAYNDYAAQTRVALFADYGLPLDRIAKIGLGPILFREETSFHREVNLSDKLTVSCLLEAMRKDGSRWTFLHELFRGDGIRAADVVVDGAWLDLATRKLGTPTTEMMEVINQFPRSDAFKWLPEDQS